MERKSYKFASGIQAYQEELSIEQDYKIAELFAELKISELSDLKEMKIHDLIKLLSGANIIERFLEVILIPADVSIELSAEKLKMLKNSEVKEVIYDFFTLNPFVRELLQSLSDEQDMTMKNPKSSCSEMNAEDTKQGS